MLFATYFGYWLMGALLIAIGMVASLLSSNVTVAFILGALFCAVPIFLGRLGDPTDGDAGGASSKSWSIPSQFQDFGTGVITLSGIFYFVGLAVAMLYLNMVLLGRRHWAGGEASRGHWIHSLVRFVAVVLALFSFTVIARTVGHPRADASAEQLHTLSTESIDLIKNIPADRPVLDPGLLQPRGPARVRRGQGRPAGPAQGVCGAERRQDPVEPGADRAVLDEARDAEKRFGIEPRRVFTDDQGKQMSTEVFLGVAFTSGVEEVVIPFFDRGLPVEYELTRSIRVVSQERAQEGRHPDHRRQADGRVRHADVQPDAGMVDRHRAEEAVRRQLGLARHADLIRPERAAGRPAVVADPEADRQPDRLHQEGRRRPCSSSTRSRSTTRRSRPRCPRCRRAARSAAASRPSPRATCGPCSTWSGIDWPSTEIVWNAYNPHPKLADLQSTPEIVFIGKGSGAADAFNPDQSASAGLQEIVTLFPGLLRPKAAAPGPSSSRSCGPAPIGGTFPGATSSSRASWASRTSTRAAATSHRHELHPGRPASPASSGRRPNRPRTDATRRTPRRRKTTSPRRRPRSTSSRSPTST